MKRKILYLLVGLILLESCSKKIEINPTQSVPENLVFNSDANIKAALNGAYDLASDGFVLGGDMMLYSELLAAGDEISWVGTYNQPREMYRQAILTNNSYVASTWARSYRTINVCNNILANISKVNAAAKWLDNYTITEGVGFSVKGANAPFDCGAVIFNGFYLR